MLVLPEDAKLQYLAEGAANIVYRITLVSRQPLSHDGRDAGTPPPTEISISRPASPDDPEIDSLSEDLASTHLLRLHKDVSFYRSTIHQHEKYSTKIRPLLDSAFLLSQYPIRLPHLLLPRLNAELKVLEAAERRPQARRGVYLPVPGDEEFGLLVEDMTASNRPGCQIIEIKPKWLVQSPNAPRNASRCRTCALRALRRAKELAKREGTADFCPLALVSSDAEEVTRAVQAIVLTQLNDLDRAKAMQFTDALVQFIKQTPLLRTLQELQQTNDPTGILALQSGKNPGERFLTAMTLRDCTLYLRLKSTRNTNGNPEVEVEAKLGDLDSKSPEPEKVEYWRRTESDLTTGGWYHGDDSDDGGSLCNLRRR